MNMGRAKQIVDASEEILVEYEGTPVWIQHLNDGEETARVYTRENPENEKVVPVASLEEKH